MPPFVALLFSNLIFGAVFAHLQEKCHWKVQTVRNVAQTISMLGSTTCLIIVVFCDDIMMSYGFLIIAQVCRQIIYCSNVFVFRSFWCFHF